MRAQTIIETACAAAIALIAVVAIPMSANSDTIQPETVEVVQEVTPVEEDRAIVLDAAGDADTTGEVQILDPVTEPAPVDVVPDGQTPEGELAVDVVPGPSVIEVPIPTAEPVAEDVIHEDDPRFDCRIHGNRTCGVVDHAGRWYNITFDEAGAPVLVARQ